MMKTVSLNSVCEINPPIPEKIKKTKEMDVAFISMSSLQADGTFSNIERRNIREVNKGYKYFEKGDVILAKITPCMENGKAAFVQDIPFQVAFGSTEFHVLRPRKDINGKYLGYIIRDPRFRKIAEENMTGTAGQRRVPTSFLERYKIHLPPLEEQIRIASLLSRIEELIAKRKESIRLLDEFVKSIFLEMFGDPVRNEKGWEKDYFENLVDKECPLTYGIVQPGNDFAGGVPIVRPVDLTQTYISKQGLKLIDPIISKQFKRTLLKGSEILMCVRGSTGIVSLATKELMGCNVTRGITPIWFSNKYNTIFAFYLLKTKQIQNEIQKLTYGIALKQINLSDLRKIELIAPPLFLQNKFASNYKKPLLSHRMM